MSEEEKKETREELSEEVSAEEAPAEEISANEAPAKEAPAEKEKKKPKSSGHNPFKSKKFKHGSLSVAFTVIFVTAIVLVNVIFNLALDRFDIKADMTEGGIFTVGDEIRGFAEDDSAKVHFYFTSERDELEGAKDTVFKQTVEMVNRLAQINSGYDVSYVNLLTNPAFSEKFSGAKSGGLIVECEDTGRYKMFSIQSDFKRYVMSDGNRYSISEAQMLSYYYGYSLTEEVSIAEQEVLSALMSVTKVDPVKIAFSSGFGESDNAALTALLEKNSYIVEKLDIDLAAEIPDDYSVLVLNAPTMDYSDEAVEKIDEWLSNNGMFGRNLVYFAVTSAPVSTPKLNAYLAEWGITVGDSFVLQMDSNYSYAATGYSSMPFYQRAEIIPDTDYYKLMQLGSGTSFRAEYVRPVIKRWDENSNYTNTALIRSYGEECVLFPFDATSEWSPDDAEKGQYDLMTEASKVRFEGNEPVYSRVIAAGSETLFNEYFMNATNYNNAEVAIALFNNISGNTDKQVMITPKSFTATTYEIDSAQSAGIGIAFAIVIPVLIIAAGITVWLRRKHL